MNISIGTQIYGLLDRLNEDFEGTIRMVRQIGFDAIEPLVVLREHQENTPMNFWALETLDRAIRCMAEVGLVVPSAHLMDLVGDPDQSSLEEIAATLKDLSHRFGIRCFVFSGLIDGQRKALSWAVLLEGAALRLLHDGISILFHNHDTEFQDGGDALALFLEKAPHISLQLDTGWVASASEEMAAVERFKDRIGALHMKDEYDEYLRSGYTHETMPLKAFCAIGSGGVRNREILGRLGALPSFSGSIVIDQDASSGDVFEDLRSGLEFIRESAGI